MRHMHISMNMWSVIGLKCWFIIDIWPSEQISSQFRHFINDITSVFILSNVFSRFMKGVISIFQDKTCAKYLTVVMLSEIALNNVSGVIMTQRWWQKYIYNPSHVHMLWVTFIIPFVSDYSTSLIASALPVILFSI